MERTLTLIACLTALFCMPLSGSGQTLPNGDLNGTVGISTIPTGWSQIPYTDPASQASGIPQATSDVTSTTGPSPGAGINGNPYSGSTFTCGLHMSGYGSIWHEGLQTTITGLVPGTPYSVTFYQTVIKQSNGLDPSGSWGVWIDATQVGVSAPSVSLQPFDSNNHPWFQRSVSFTATAASHVIKFLPMDDDPNITAGADGLRMGIDSINIRAAVVLASAMDFDLEAMDEKVKLSWEVEQGDEAVKYLVERSSDGFHFESLEQMEGNRAGYYSCMDALPYIASHYRVGRVDTDGQITYSQVKMAQTQGELGSYLKGRELQIHGGYELGYQVTLYDMRGQQVLDTRVDQSLDLSGLDGGLYLLHVVSSGRESRVLQKKIFLY